MMVLNDNDRRNDIGTKIILAIYSSVVAILLGLFVHAAWSSAEQGNIKAETAIAQQSLINERIAKLEVYYISYGDDLREIKNLLKRQAPQEGNRLK